MKTSIAIGALLFATVASRAFAAFGFADTVIVTGNLDAGELAHRAQEIAQLVQQVEQATMLVRQANTLVQFAGDPKAAVRNLGDLARITDALGRVMGVENGTASGLRQASDTALAAGQMQDSMERLQYSFDGLQREISVFGKKQGSSPDLYQALYAAEQIATAARAQLKKETEARKQIDDELKSTYDQLRNAQSESEKQALAAKIAALEARHNVMTAQRQALLADIELERRQSEAATGAALAQQHEVSNAEADVLLASRRQRQQESEQRLNASLQTVPASRSSFDYGAVTSVWGAPKP